MVALELPFIFVASNPIVGDDIWWNLKNGQLMVEQGKLIARDLFTFTPLEADHINAPWLAQLLFHTAYALGGPGLLIFANALAAAAAFGLVFATSWERTRNVRLAALVNVAAFTLVASNLSTRPQMLSYVLFALCAYALTLAPRRGQWLAVLPLSVMLWVNLHGSYPLALVLIGCHLGGAAWSYFRERTALKGRLARNYALTLTASLVAVLANPYGLEAILYVQRIGSNPIIRGLISEWRPPTLNDPLGFGLFVSFALVVALLYRSPRPLPARDLLLLVAFGLLAIQSVRNVVWWALVATPVAAEHLAALSGVQAAGRLLGRLDARSGTSPAWVVWTSASLVGLVLLVSLPWIKAANPLLPEEKRSLLDANLPFGGVEFIKRQPAGRIYNYQLWGGYLVWELWPRHQVYGDGRIEIHPPEVWRDYLKLRYAHADWQRLLDQYGVDYLFLHPTDQDALIAVALASPSWRLLYGDPVVAVFGRRGGAR